MTIAADSSTKCVKSEKFSTRERKNVWVKFEVVLIFNTLVLDKILFSMSER